ncbi:MAG: cache domain-containing protein [Salinivirgaceae bacterium]|nr:cache domain-containing protein [Salinivirgaceae bacterium]
MSFFKVKKEYYELSKDTIIPDNIIKQIEVLKQNIQRHYLANYMSFYDILFIDKSGEIFYTIKKQGDYHKNIFKDELSKTNLSKKLLDNPKESFIDFQFYSISGEPSAFFIEPVFENGVNLGWIVMQCAINKINSMFISDNMGLTGEVLIVNKDHFMLTNSRFKVEPTILKQQLPAENIESKFKEKHGKKVVIDYRGKEVYSVFDVFDFFGSEWLLISKIDKNELVSRYYKENRDLLYPMLEAYLKKAGKFSKVHLQKSDSILNVDMDEFSRGDTTKVIQTQGVSTCTAVNFLFPWRFSYLAHISPYDVIYNEKRTDITSQVFKHISYFEITESEKDELEFQIMSTQLRSLKKLIDVIIDKGHFLSQIKFMCNEDAEYGNFFCDIAGNTTVVNWELNSTNNSVASQNFNEVDNLETILLKMVN